MKIEDKVVVITGASEGIGREIALRLAREHTQLALIARDTDHLSSVCAEAQQLGAKDARAYTCDIRDTQALQQIATAIVSDFGTVDVLINNAGIWQKKDQLDNIAPETIDAVIATNLTALIHLTRLLLPTLRTREEAAIVNISSRSGVTVQEQQSVYTASKYGVRGFTEVLTVDLKDTNVRVAGVYQGGTNTHLFATAGETFPTDTFTNPADLADVIAYMLTRPPHLWIHDIRIDH